MFSGKEFDISESVDLRDTPHHQRPIMNWREVVDLIMVVDLIVQTRHTG
jgi:hypothetical protein